MLPYIVFKITKQFKISFIKEKIYRENVSKVLIKYIQNVKITTTSVIKLIAKNGNKQLTLFFFIRFALM